MSAKVVRLRAIDGGPGAECVEVIGQLKARLRRGDVRGVAFVLTYADGRVDTCMGGQSDGQFHSLVSGAAVLTHRLMQERNA